MSAIDHATNGLFDNGAITKWKRGSNVEVVWRGTQHGGQLEVLHCFHLMQAAVCYTHIVTMSRFDLTDFVPLSGSLLIQLLDLF